MKTNSGNPTPTISAVISQVSRQPTALIPSLNIWGDREKENATNTPRKPLASPLRFSNHFITMFLLVMVSTPWPKNRRVKNPITQSIIVMMVLLSTGNAWLIELAIKFRWVKYTSTIPIIAAANMAMILAPYRS